MVNFSSHGKICVKNAFLQIFSIRKLSPDSVSLILVDASKKDLILILIAFDPD